jgi:hypothetical protein
MTTTKIIEGRFKLMIDSEIDRIPDEIMKSDIEKAFKSFGFGQNAEVTILSQKIVKKETTGQ